MNKELVVMVFDIGGTTIKSGIINRKGEIIHKLKTSSQAQKGAKYIFKNIKFLGNKLLKYSQKNSLRPQSIGISTAGTVDLDRGVIAFSTETFKNWQGAKVKKKVEDMFEIPVYLENDAHAAAWGEKYLGIAKEIDDFVMITLGTGIGGAIFSKGKLFDGSSNFAGLIGMMSVEPKGYECELGVKGCLEAFSSGWGFARLSEEIVSSNSFKYGKNSPITSKIKSGEKVSPEDVFAAVSEGDIIGQMVLDRVILYLGTGIGNLISILNPELIILAGGISRAGNRLLRPLNYSVSKHCPRQLFEKIEIKFSAYRENCGLIGAAAVGFTEGIPRLN